MTKSSKPTTKAAFKSKPPTKPQPLHRPIMEPNAHTPPYWSHHHRNRRQPSPILNPIVLIIAIPILILILLFFILPPFISHASQIIRPSSVKKSWDYFNIVLVLFAILCGFFARRNDDVPSPDESAERQNPETITTGSTFVNEPRHSVVSWLEFPDRKMYESVEAENGVRLRRSSSSYPDLRQESLWENGGGIGNEFRFYDDFEINNYRSRENSNMGRRISPEVVSRETETIVREIPVDKFEVNSEPPPPTPPRPSPPPPPPPPAATPRKQRRSYQSIPREEKQEEILKVETETQPSEPPPAPASPASPTPVVDDETEFQFPDVISETVYKKKTGTMKKELATAITSLYKGQKRKRKKRVTKNRDIYENAPHNSPPLQPPPSTQPPPPPPPPPPITITPSKKLQNLFKKGIKQKRVHSDPPTAPPPPPPPTKNVFNNIFKNKRLPTLSSIPSPPPMPPNSILNSIINTTGNISRRFKNVTSSSTPPPPPPMPETRRKREVLPGKPPKPPRRRYEFNESTMYAPQSPLIPMPPPPPPPPFKINRRDYTSVENVSNLPEIDDFDVMSVKSEGEDLIGSSSNTCPSPDVNAKADNFIARLRDEWRLEKMNSMKEKKREFA